MSEIEIVRLTAADLRDHLPKFVELLRDAVNNGASVNFIAPLDAERAHAFWEKIAADAERGERIIFAAMADGRVVGTAQLVLAMQPNGLHRAEVQKMLVHSAYRRRGIARELLTAVDRVAREIGRTLLVLDTEQGSAAETLYESFGYQRVGVIPGFALRADGESLVATVMFYRQMPDIR
jgi:acetyltransferase